MTPRDTVRQGYDAIAASYLQERNHPSADQDLLEQLETRLPQGARVLDLGCGAGLPIARRLARLFAVTGIDFSEAQLELARRNVPEAEFLCADMVDAELGEARFDAVCSFYAIIHVPREHHEPVLAKVHRALVPGGLSLLCLGAEDLEADRSDDYFGWPMFWSHFDAKAYLSLHERCGLTVLDHWLVTDASHPASKHLFVLARK